MMTHDYIEHQLCEYMIVQKLYTHRHIDIKTVCHKMEVTPAEFTEYLKERLSTSFKKVMHSYRIEEAKDLWEKSGTTPICQIAHAVGYGNSVAFLLHFARFERCLPYVRKKRNLAPVQINEKFSHS